jgi:hypothetical protein
VPCSLTARRHRRLTKRRVVSFTIPRSLDSHEFEPSWQALLDSVVSHDIHIAQVDCARHAGALAAADARRSLLMAPSVQCRKLGLFVYPQLSIYRDGMPLETYRSLHEIYWQFLPGRIAQLAGMPTWGEERRAQVTFSTQ